MKKSWVQILQGAGLSSSLSILKSLMKALRVLTQMQHNQLSLRICCQGLKPNKLKADRISKKELSVKRSFLRVFCNFWPQRGLSNVKTCCPTLLNKFDSLATQTFSFRNFRLCRRNLLLRIKTFSPLANFVLSTQINIFATLLQLFLRKLGSHFALNQINHSNTNPFSSEPG